MFCDQGKDQRIIPHIILLSCNNQCTYIKEIKRKCTLIQFNLLDKLHLSIATKYYERFSHKKQLDHTWCPEKVLTGRFSPILQTWITLSVEQVAKELLFRQSTSSVGPEWIYITVRKHTKETLSLPRYGVKYKSTTKTEQVQQNTWMKFKLLFPFARHHIPNNGSCINTTAKEIITFLVPLQGEDWPSMFV